MKDARNYSRMKAAPSSTNAIAHTRTSRLAPTWSAVHTAVPSFGTRSLSFSFRRYDVRRVRALVARTKRIAFERSQCRARMAMLYP